MRLPTFGGVLAWEFLHPESGAKVLFAPQGRVLTNSSDVLKNLALAGLGLVWLFDDIVQQELNSGALVSVLDDWAMHYDGYYLYYPNRCMNAPTLQALVACLKE